MQFGKITLTGLILLFFLIVQIPVSAQVIRENEKGEKIIVGKDGIARYFATGEPVPTSEGDASTYPMVRVQIEPLEGTPIPLNEDDLTKISLRRAQLASEAVAIAKARAEEALKNRVRLEQELNKATGDNRKQLERQLARAKTIERETALEALEAQSVAVRADALTAKGAYVLEHNRQQKKRREALQARQANNEIGQNYSASLPLTDNFSAVANDPDLILYPPSPPCQMQYEGPDAESGQYRREVKKELLFTYTDERLRSFLKDKEYMQCKAFFTAIGGYRFLTLEFNFAYPNAREAYGFIEKGSILTVRMLNGAYVNLRSGRLDHGSYDTQKEILSYQVYYPIDRSQLSILKNGEVDALRVFWSSGYEEYPVNQMDLFQKQLSCLGER